VAYFTDAEYAGGYDEQQINVSAGASYIELKLYYQGTSREYVQFLRDQINGTASTLSSPTPSGEARAYVIQTDPFFAKLKAWGTTMWDLWRHNHGLDGSGKQIAGIVPFAMAQATVGAPPAPACSVPGTPGSLAATPGKRQVQLTWNAVAPAPSGGYRVYWDLSGRLQLRGGTLNTSYIDTGLTPDTRYCYVVKSWNDCDGNGSFNDLTDKESGASGIACATPTRR
jgi:hypothetical protein